MDEPLFATPTIYSCLIPNKTYGSLILFWKIFPPADYSITQDTILRIKICNYSKVASSNASRFVTRLVYMHTQIDNFLIKSPSRLYVSYTLNLYHKLHFSYEYSQIFFSEIHRRFILSFIFPLVCTRFVLFFHCYSISHHICHLQFSPIV
jgi:hypothetical protein